MIWSYLKQLTSIHRIQSEKSRLEAFLSAMPGDYCGFSDDGTIAYSQGFLDLLGLNNISNVEDILSSFDTMHAGALDAYIGGLHRTGRHFLYQCPAQLTGKMLKITGTRGKAMDESDFFSILWLEDISADLQFLNHKISDLTKRAEQAEYDGDRMRHVMDAMPLFAWTRDSNGDLTWCNAAYADALATPRADIIAQQIELPMTGANRRAVAGDSSSAAASTSSSSPSSSGQHSIKALAIQAMNDHMACQDKYHVIIDGKRLLFQIQETPLSGDDGTLGMAQNITREESLEDEQKRYVTANEELLGQLQTAIGIFTAKARLEFYNDAFARLWNLEGSWLNAQPRLGDIMDKLRETRQLPEQADFRGYKQEWLDMFTNLLAPHEQMLYLPNGKVLRMLAIPHPMGGLMMTFEDVTSRLELESSYNTLVAVQKETLDNLSEAVVVFGEDGRVKLWNPSFRKLWGLHNEDLDNDPHVTKLTDKLRKFFASDQWPDQRDILLQMAINRHEQTGRIDRQDDVFLEYATVPLPDGGMLITFFDVSDTVRAAQALQEKNKALEEAEKLKSDFLANVSYQLRTPLNSIMGFNDILTHAYFGPLNDKQQEYTAGIAQASEKLRDLIDNILDLASFEAGKLTLNKSQINIHHMIDQIYEATSDWAQKEGIDLTYKCPKNIGEIEADSQRLKQALLNVIRNAIAFTPQGGKINLQAKRDKTSKDLIIQVNDNGVGIAQEDISRIFQPFERVDTQRLSDGETARGGVGLGLSLVKNIIELHQGQVDIQSTPQKGTQVTITIPDMSDEG